MLEVGDIETLPERVLELAASTRDFKINGNLLSDAVSVSGRSDTSDLRSEASGVEYTTTTATTTVATTSVTHTTTYTQSTTTTTNSVRQRLPRECKKK